MTPTEHPLYWSLRSIARIERKDDDLRSPRLTEPGMIKWNRMRRRLDSLDFIALLHEDLADAFPYPFDLSQWQADPLADLGGEAADRLITAALTEDTTTPQAFLRQASRALGLPTGGNIADLPKVQPHQAALELPGSGGRIAIQQFFDHGVAIHDRFTFVADSDVERHCLGLAIVEMRANAPKVWSLEQARAMLASGARFDHVFGVPDHAPALALVSGSSLEVRWS